MQWIDRNRNFINFTLASLLRRKGKNLSLLLVYTLVVFILSSVIFFSVAIRHEAKEVLQSAPQLVVQRMVAGRYELMPETYIEKISGIRGVGKIKSRLWGYYYHPASQANYTILTDYEFEHGDDSAVVGNGVMRTWEPREPKQLYISTHDGDLAILSVAGLIKPETELMSADLIVVSVAAFRNIFGIPEGMVTDLALTVRNETECPIIAEKINFALPDTRAVSREEMIRTYSALFDLRSGYIVVILSMSVLAFFIFAWDKATGLSAQEKAEIGILKALGWDTADVLLMKFWEGAIISVTAFLSGVMLAYLHVFLAHATLFEHAMKGWATLYPDFTLKPTVDLFQLATLFFLTVFPYSLITILPTWRAASADPDAVMRQV